MSISENEETWEEFYRTNQTIPPHSSRTTDVTAGGQAYCFCLNLKSIELDFKSESENDFQLRASFYDGANHCFFGSTWIGPITKSEIISVGKHFIDFNEFLYFHSTIKDVTISLVIEFVDAGKPILQTVGWTWLRIFTNFESLTDTNETARPQERRVEFYHGSPLALLQIQEPLEECQNLRKVNSCQFFCTIQTHEQLENVLRYIPKNVPISGDDIIPGIEEVAEEYSDDVIDILRSPTPLRPWPCHLTKCTIYLMPSIEKFEEYLCTLLNNERLKKDELPADGSVVRISERKLKVGVHNGWNFIQAPRVVYLEKETATPNKPKRRMSKTGSRPASSLSIGSRDGVNGSLVLRGRLDLNEMVHHSLFAIVFLLEYVVNIPVTQPELPAGKKARSKLGSSFGSIPLAKKVSIGVRMAAWCPFENGQMPNQTMSLELKGNLPENPFDQMVFAEALCLDDMHFDSLGKIEFNFVQNKLKKMEGTSVNRSISREGRLEEETMVALPTTPAQMIEKGMMSPAIQQTGLLFGKPPLPSQQQRSSQQQQQLMDAQYLEELPRSQLYSSLVIPSTDTPHIAALSRVAHSLLYTVDYPTIKDSQGNTPFNINPEEKVSYNLPLENRDALHTNEIVLQFLAVSRCDSRCVFFTFQFYRFPQTITERLHLKKLNEERSDGILPSILQRSARDGQPSPNSPPGLTIKYTVDPAFMQTGEKTSFLHYLLEQRLNIDMWDGDSLLLIGSTSTPLKYLLRQCKPAVQVSQELDVVFTEYAEDHPTLAGDLTNTGLPSGMKVSLKAKLCLRIGNVGFLPETNLEKLEEFSKSIQSRVLHPHSTMIETRNMDKLKPSLKTTAKLMSDCDPELASVLLTRKPDTMGRSDKMKKNQIDNIRKRKLDRMKAVRQIEGEPNEMASGFILLKEEKVQRTRDLRTIQVYRDKMKFTNIQSKLEDSITTKHILHSSLGQTEFFEFVLKNPSHKDQVVYIKTNDTELKVITDGKEWRHYKKLHNVNTAMEDQMFSISPEDGVKLFLKGNESVHVPFKFQSFTSFSTTPEMGPSHPLYAQSHSYSLQTFGKDTMLTSKEIKASFTGNDMKPLALLMVSVELHPHTIHQTFRFYHPEQTFLKKAIRLPPFHSIQGASSNIERTPTIVTARCSDESVICETHQVVSGEPQEVFLKVPCGVSPNLKRFFVIVFIDNYCSKPCQIWQFYIHSLQRIDMTVTEGQTSKFSVLLKGTQSSRMVKCYPSHPAEIQVSPHDSFMLAANGIQEISLKINPLTTGKRMMFLNVVDQEFHQLIKSWLLMITSREPCITKAFEVQQIVGGGAGSNKKISFTNPYPVKKTFKFHTNRPDLLKFQENGIMLGGGETHNISLCFLPQQSEGESTLLVFINDRDGKNEETFCIKIFYRKF